MVETEELATPKERVTKRRKTDENSGKAPRSRVQALVIPTGTSPYSSATRATSIPTGTTEQKRLQWLAALSRSELEATAAGLTWNPGDPHNEECFVCSRAGRLLGCLNCPRSYHAECVGVAVAELINVESWACPACALLGLDGAKDLSRSLNQNECAKRETARPVNVPAVSTVNGPREGSVPKSGKREIILSNEQEKGKKRSRYSTLPNEVDEALAIINRELEAASHSKSIIAHMDARLHVTEQDLAIERGKAALAASKTNLDELYILKEQAQHKDLMIEQMKKDNAALKAEVEKYAHKVKELEDWKQRMRMMIDGNMG